jgi:hypothetical protein
VDDHSRDRQNDRHSPKTRRPVQIRLVRTPQTFGRDCSLFRPGMGIGEHSGFLSEVFGSGIGRFLIFGRKSIFQGFTWAP